MMPSCKPFEVNGLPWRLLAGIQGLVVSVLLHLGVAIEKARKARGWTQGELGAAAGLCRLPGDESDVVPISTQWISTIERDPYRASYGVLVRVAAALETTVGQLEATVGTRPVPLVSSVDALNKKNATR